jgi:hypothetical protein
MTAATLTADTTTPARKQAQRAFLWVAMLTLGWLILNYWFPGINASGVPSMTTRLGIHIAIALGLWLALERTDLVLRQRVTVWLTLMVPSTLWLAVIWNAAIFAVFRPAPGDGLPPLPLAIFVPVIVGTPFLLLSKRVGQVLDAMPASWLVALQVYRVFGGVFLVGWLRGVVFGPFALPAGIGDVATGLMALPVAYLLTTGTDKANRAGVLWNIFGLVDFAVAIMMGTITAPGPLQLIVPNIPSIAAGAYPTVLIPAFAVPSSILLHVLSLRQLSRRRAAG